MPCGGIYPLDIHWASKFLDENDKSHTCFYCNEMRKDGKIVSHFVEEWDAYIHADCIDDFLKTPEGQIVINHGHEIVR